MSKVLRISYIYSETLLLFKPYTYSFLSIILKSLKHKIWIDAGLVQFSDSGKIELNNLCREVKLTKPSFYHVYPNWPDSRGTERFFLDMLQELDIRLDKLAKAMSDILDSFPIHESLDKLLKAVENNFVEFKCMAQLSSDFSNVKAQRLFQKHHNILCTNKVRIFQEFYPDLAEETIRLICSSILRSGYIIAKNNKDIKLWRGHVLSVNRQLYQEVYKS